MKRIVTGCFILLVVAAALSGCGPRPVAMFYPPLGARPSKPRNVGPEGAQNVGFLDNRRFILLHRNDRIRVRNAETLAQEMEFASQRLPGASSGICILKDRGGIAFLSYKQIDAETVVREVRILDLVGKQEQVVATLSSEIKGIVSAEDASCVAIMGDSDARGGDEYVARIETYDTTSWKKSSEFSVIVRHGGSRGLALSPDGRWLAVSFTGDRIVPGQSEEAQPTGSTLKCFIVLYDLTAGKEKWMVNVGIPVDVLCFAKDGKQLWGVTGGGHVLQYNVDSGEEMSRREVRETWWVHGMRYRVRLTHVAVTPDNQYLIVASHGSTNVWIWRLPDTEYKSIRVFPKNELGVSAMALSPDGQYLVTGNLAGRIKVWSLKELVE